MEQILLRRKNGDTELLNSTATVSSVKKAEHRKTLLGEDVIVVNLESAAKREFNIGDSIKPFGKTYKINQIPREEKRGERQFVYEIVFEGVQYDLIRVTYRNEDSLQFNTSSDFTLTGDIEMFLNVIINNANRVFGANKWALGDFPANTETKTLLFNAENCLSVLTKICTEYNYQFVFEETSTQTILHVRQTGTDLNFNFQYGKGKGLYSLSRQKVDSKNIINTLYAYGSTKNIPANYKNYSERLRLGLESGDSILIASDSIDAFGIFEGVVIFEDIYPKRTGVVSTVTSLLEFSDSTMFDLNEVDGSGNTKYLIAGTSAKIHFNNGNLAGYEFEIEKYTHSTRTFKIKQIQAEKGVLFPSATESTFTISEGDKYVLVDIVMPLSYISAAETELETRAGEFLNDSKNPTVQYGLEIDEYYLKAKTNSANVFDVCDTVSIEDADFNINNRIKITGFTRDVLYPYRYTLTISDVIERGILAKLTSKTKQVVDIIGFKRIDSTIKYTQDPTNVNQIISQIDTYLGTDKPLIIGRNASELELGNPLNGTLVKVLGGSFQIGEGDRNIFKDISNIDESGNLIDNRLRYEGDLLDISGDFGVAGRLNVGVDFSMERTNPSGDIFQNLISATEDIVFDAPNTIINNILGANQIGGIGSAGVTGIGNWTFNNPITIATPTAPNHAVTQAFFYAALDAAMNGGNRLYGFVYAAATTNITLSGSQVVDGVTPPNGEKVLAYNQTDKTKNGVWIVNTSGAWTRASDFLDIDGYGNVQISVITGTANASAIFVCDIKTVITINTTEITFTKIYQPFAQQYIAYTTAGSTPQDFYGTHIFNGKIKGQTPTETNDLTTKFYVDAQDTVLSNSISSAISGLSSVYWGKISGNGLGIGTINSDAFNLYQNNTRRATINGSSMLGLGYLSIANGVFSSVYSGNGIGDYGLTVAKSVHFGYMTGNTIATPTFDVSIGYSSGDAFYRFGKWNSGGFFTEFKRGIQYDSDNNLHIGTFTASSGINNGKTLATNSKITIAPDGKIGAGVTPTEKLHIDGNFLLTGVIKPSGNAPTGDEQFLVSNSTTGNKYINFNQFGKFQAHEGIANDYSAPFGASFIHGNGTDATGLPNDVSQGHVIKMSIGSEYPDQYTMIAFGRPFGNYFDGNIYVKGMYGAGATTDWKRIGDVQDYTTEFTEYDEVIRGVYYEQAPNTKQAFFGINKVTGDLLMRLNVQNDNDSTIKQYNNIMSIEDGRLYYSDAEGNDPVRYALITEVGDAGGAIYSFEEPMYVDATQKVRIRYASPTQNGIITADEYNILLDVNNKISDGGAVNNELKFNFLKPLKFMNSDGSDFIGKIISTSLDVDTLFIVAHGDMELTATQNLYLNPGNSSSNMVFIENVGFDLSAVSSLEGSNAKFFISNIGGGKYKATLVAA